MPDIDIDWDDPAARGALLDRVGIDAYRKAFDVQWAARVIETVNGHAIRPVRSERFGRLYLLGKTGQAYVTIERAREVALGYPEGNGK